MAELGYRTVNEMVGQSHVLKIRGQIDNWKINRLDLTPVLHFEQTPKHVGLYHQIDQDHELENVLDYKIINQLEQKAPERILELDIKNTDRTTGALLSHHIIKNKLVLGNPIEVKFTGSAGQSFGAFLAPNIHFQLIGEANDYVAKGLSGGKIVVKPHPDTSFEPHKNIIIGNVSLYGATSGEIYINGMAGERFCVRNSGAEAVVEGIGDHGCEYMTGGLAIILGNVGNNFGAGMSGGIAYIWDRDEKFERRCNTEMVSIEQPLIEDLDLIKSKIEIHASLTGSPLANEILADWMILSNHFLKVMPNDLKRVLESRNKEIQVA
jgi:glutamate synthase (NADPH/NADH) large chain